MRTDVRKRSSGMAVAFAGFVLYSVYVCTTFVSPTTISSVVEIGYLPKALYLFFIILGRMVGLAAVTVLLVRRKRQLPLAASVAASAACALVGFAIMAIVFQLTAVAHIEVLLPWFLPAACGSARGMRSLSCCGSRSSARFPSGRATCFWSEQRWWPPYCTSRQRFFLRLYRGLWLWRRTLRRSPVACAPCALASIPRALSGLSIHRLTVERSGTSVAHLSAWRSWPSWPVS